MSKKIMDLFVVWQKMQKLFIKGMLFLVIIMFGLMMMFGDDVIDFDEGKFIML